MKNNIKCFILVAGMLATSCANDQKGGYEVKYAGKLREIMHKNDISGKIAIDSLLERPGLFAVGALDSLSGEILVEEGTLYISRVEGEEVSLSKAKNAQATLLVYAHVNDWKRVQLPDSLNSMEELEGFLAHLANTQRVSKPMLFRLSGMPTNIRYHIIRPLGANATHRERKAAGFSGVLTGEQVSIIGFYSDQHQGVFTHRDSNVHMHVRNDNESIAGHVDDIQLGSNVQLYIPVE
ncbi:acetolactate decarboxylase [Fulvivirga sp. 29W222]|uniref:Acetolactate decarboxylase n=1 Tax=Fulvivirga marina TaxID=2494733 RepID=A0A937FVZ7_9BACT|nr:acetolactate decarboxylase [Fulvivirga marina]MBL6447145.1 acetolactate decarboxylase [Fulvivirga marina]